MIGRARHRMPENNQKHSDASYNIHKSISIDF